MNEHSLIEITGPATSPSTDDQIVVLKALSDPTRLRLLRLLGREELNVQELCHILDLPQPRISRHLGVLRKAGLVCHRREGTRVFCRAAALPGSLLSLTAYTQALTNSGHPDLERLQECLRSRSRYVRAFADDKASQWDDVGRRLHSTTASLLALANLAPRGMTLADLGTGTGLLLPFLAALADCVYAVDQSAEMLRRARERCQGLGIANVTFVQAAMEELDQEVPPCDGLLLHFVLHQVARPGLAIRHLARLLRPEGRLVLVDRVQHQDEQAKTTFGSLWLGFAKEQLDRWLAEAELTHLHWHPLTGDRGNGEPSLDVFVSVAARGHPMPDVPLTDT